MKPFDGSFYLLSEAHCQCLPRPKSEPTPTTCFNQVQSWLTRNLEVTYQIVKEQSEARHCRQLLPPWQAQTKKISLGNWSSDGPLPTEIRRNDTHRPPAVNGSKKIVRIPLVPTPRRVSATAPSRHSPRTLPLFCGLCWQTSHGGFTPYVENLFKPISLAFHNGIDFLWQVAWQPSLATQTARPRLNLVRRLDQHATRIRSRSDGQSDYRPRYGAHRFHRRPAKTPSPPCCHAI